jgi:O-antigen ligase
MVNSHPTESQRAAKPLAFAFMYAVPYLILMFCRVSNFGAAQTTEVAADDGAQKMLLEAFAYGVAGLLIGVKLVELKSLLGRLLPFYLYAMYAALTMVWSDHPESVEYRVGHMIGLLLVAICVSIWAQQRRERIFFLTAGFMLLALVASVAVVLVLPGRGLSHPEWGSVGGSRWVGITGHPNLLGAAAFVGIWTALAVMTMSKSMQLRLLSVFLILLAIVALRGSDSRSSAISAACCAVVFFLLRGGTPDTFISVFVRRALVLAGFGGVVIAFGFLVAPEFIMQHLAPTARAGAGDVLSDRPLIWAMGFDAIRDNPMGWTFDLLESYWDGHGRAVLFPHFHNGFLDVAVKGGPIAEVLMLAILFRMAWSIKALMRVDYGLFALYAAFFSSNLLYNIIDTGFDREAILWPMMVVAWAVVEATVIAKARAAEAPEPAARNFAARVRPPPSAIGFE